MKNKEKYQQKFIDTATNKFHGKYDYSKVDYKGATENVCIICPEHGEFWQTPSNHIRSVWGCPYCGCSNHKQTTETFIKKAEQTFPGRYNYEKTKYINDRTKVIITCPEHGDFEVRPNRFLTSKGCPRCNNITNTEDFIKVASKLHNSFYDYNLVQYVNTITPVKIICPIHGEFEQRPVIHLTGAGCPECGKIRIGDAHRMDKSEFISRATKLHFGKYGYDKVEYRNAESKVTITCPIHGDFDQTPNNHLKGYGCHCCKSSLGELVVEHWLKKYGKDYSKQVGIYLPESGRKTGMVYIDFVLKCDNKTYFIEFNGEQHYLFSTNWHKTEDRFIEQQKRDESIRQYCINNNIQLIEIKYDQDVFEVLNEKFNVSLKRE